MNVHRRVPETGARLLRFNLTGPDLARFAMAGFDLRPALAMKRPNDFRLISVPVEPDPHDRHHRHHRP